MPHYACNFSDVELLTSYRWIKGVGCADQSAYDLMIHSKRTGAPLVIKEILSKPRRVTKWKVTLDMKVSGPRFERSAKKVQEAVERLGDWGGCAGGAVEGVGGERDCYDP